MHVSAPEFMVKPRREQCTWRASVYECIAEQFPDEPIVVNKANPMQPASTKMQEARAFHRAFGGQSSSVLLGPRSHATRHNLLHRSLIVFLKRQGCLSRSSPRGRSQIIGRCVSAKVVER